MPSCKWISFSSFHVIFGMYPFFFSFYLHLLQHRSDDFHRQRRTHFFINRKVILLHINVTFLVSASFKYRGYFLIKCNVNWIIIKDKEVANFHSDYNRPSNQYFLIPSKRKSFLRLVHFFFQSRNNQLVDIFIAKLNERQRKFSAVHHKTSFVVMKCLTSCKLQ